MAYPLVCARKHGKNKLEEEMDDAHIQSVKVPSGRKGLCIRM
jgi:hypothetical protein